MPDGKVDVDTSILDSLDFEAVCEIRVSISFQTTFGRRRRGPQSGPCSQPAKWLFTCRGCGIEFVVCESHRRQLVDSVATSCNHCELQAPLNTVFWVRKLPGGGPHA